MPTLAPEPAGRADAAALLRKSFECSFKFQDGDDAPEGTFELYAAIFGNVDRGGEVIEPGAFLNLDEFIADGVGLVGHDLAGLPVAYVVSAVQDAKGLRVCGRFHSDPEAQRCRTVVRERIDAGKSVKCSIGYRVLDSVREQVGGKPILRLKKMNVYEFSFVNLPMNPLAGVVAAKSAGAGEEPAYAPAEKPGVVGSVMRWLGLASKKGRGLTRADHARLKAFAESTAQHGVGSDELVEVLKAATRSVAEHGEGSKVLAATMLTHLAEVDPDGEDDAEDDGPEGGGKKSDEDLRRRLKLRARRIGPELDTPLERRS